MKIIYLPLDERPCNLKYPQKIAQSNEKIELIAPCEKILGKKKKPAKFENIKNFIDKNIKAADALIFSIDMLCYGGLIPSRIHNENLGEISKKLNFLKEIKEKNKKLKIYPFTSIMRTPKYNSNDEEPHYYEIHGENIFKNKYLIDKEKRVGLTQEEKEELSEINVPSEIILDYENRRKVNRKVNTEIINLLNIGLFEQLTIFQDDSAPYGYTAIDQKKIKDIVATKNLNNKVFIYPGADEVGCTMLVKAYNEYNEISNTIYAEYSSVKGPTLIPLYEDRPMYETLKSHVMATRSFLVNDENSANYILMINSPGKIMQESWDQLEKRDRTYDSDRNIKYFVEKIKYYVKNKKKVIIADTAYANGGDLELVKALDSHKLLDKIYAYAGWNTHANTLGTVLAQGLINNELNKNTIKCNIEHILEDVFYQAIIRMDITNNYLDKYELNYFDLKNKEKEITTLEIRKMKKMYQELILNKKYPITKINIAHPWNRMFEIDINIEF